MTFMMREPTDALVPVEFRADIAMRLPETFRHVANEVYISDDDERYWLRDTAKAIETALSRPGDTVTVHLTHREILIAVPALDEVMREVFDGDTAEHSHARFLLSQAKDALEAAEEPYVSASGPRR